ncbi:MAG TPA: acyl-CoA dehydrogenase family protein [Steroidobacteraceae bacterium]|nr:acyl-CoA dehydrogenase family protein [Steroidobacteraceae bacterium]
MAVLTEEQMMLRDAARSWAQESSPVTAFRKLRDEKVAGGFRRETWKEMADMGWAGILIPENYGGVGMGYQTLGLVLEETGRTLTASALISTALAASTALVLGGSDKQNETWLPKIASGDAIGALAIDETPHHDPAHVKCEAKRDGEGWRLNGKKRFVVDGGIADFLIVSAKTGSGITLFVLPAAASGITRQALAMADSRGMADIDFENVQAAATDVLGTVDQGLQVLEPTLDRTRAGLSAEMLGAATQAFETTLDYLKVRTQFGKLIGSFQSLQHRAGKMFVDLELGRSCVEAALAAIDNNAPDASTLSSLAKARMSDTFHLVSNEMVQMHGGIGMTDVHDAGLYIKRARVAETTFGSAGFHRDRYARAMGY